MFEFCGIVSNLLGSKAIDWSGIKTVDEDCNFTPLPYLVLITQIVIPIGIRIPAVFLIPNVYQTENLIDWANDLMAKACISNCFSNKYDIVFYSNKSCILSNLSLPLVIFVQLVGMVLNFSFQISSLEDKILTYYILNSLLRVLAQLILNSLLRVLAQLHSHAKSDDPMASCCECELSKQPVYLCYAV